MDWVVSFAEGANRHQAHLAPYARFFGRTEFHIARVCCRIPEMHDLMHQRQREVVLLLLSKRRLRRAGLDQELHEPRLGDEDRRLITKLPCGHEHIWRQRSIGGVCQKRYLETGCPMFPHHPPKMITDVFWKVGVLRSLRVAQCQQLIGSALEFLVCEYFGRRWERRTEGWDVVALRSRRHCHGFGDAKPPDQRSDACQEAERNHQRGNQPTTSLLLIASAPSS